MRFIGLIGYPANAIIVCTRRAPPSHSYAIRHSPAKVFVILEISYASIFWKTPKNCIVMADPLFAPTNFTPTIRIRKKVSPIPRPLDQHGNQTGTPGYLLLDNILLSFLPLGPGGAPWLIFFAPRHDPISYGVS
ncbi:hypothetical protein OG252_24615 [Streptomyces sp. NBC_01352]|uniref:hypothetical protein n=1 Tax=Streptomyces sp. NBC_01352 TaxID=2903834 RepID=UPI002E328D37|nr:hypothetical protein [Streptomyces sp. NBC_01352]